MATCLLRKNNFVWQHRFYQCSYNIWSMLGKWLPWVQLLFRLRGISRVLLRNKYWLIIWCSLTYWNHWLISEIYLKVAIANYWYLAYQWEHGTLDGIHGGFRDPSCLSLHLKLQKLNVRTVVSSYDFNKIMKFPDANAINSIH